MRYVVHNGELASFTFAWIISRSRKGAVVVRSGEKLGPHGQEVITCYPNTDLGLYNSHYVTSIIPLTAQAWCNGPNTFCNEKIDVDPQPGLAARQIWRHYRRDEEMPSWLWLIDENRALRAGLTIYPRTLDAWDKIDRRYGKIRDRGVVICSYLDSKYKGEVS